MQEVCRALGGGRRPAREAALHRALRRCNAGAAHERGGPAEGTLPAGVTRLARALQRRPPEEDVT